MLKKKILSFRSFRQTPKIVLSLKKRTEGAVLLGPALPSPQAWSHKQARSLSPARSSICSFHHPSLACSFVISFWPNIVENLYLTNACLTRHSIKRLTRVSSLAVSPLAHTFPNFLGKEQSSKSTELLIYTRFGLWLELRGFVKDMYLESIILLVSLISSLHLYIQFFSWGKKSGIRPVLC